MRGLRRLHRELDPGCEIPWGYGVAWYDPRTRTAICYPIGLAWLIGLARRVWLEAIRPPRPPRIDELEAELEGLRNRLGLYQRRDAADAKTARRITEAVARGLTQVAEDDAVMRDPRDPSPDRKLH